MMVQEDAVMERLIDAHTRAARVRAYIRFHQAYRAVLIDSSRQIIDRAQKQITVANRAISERQ